MYNIKNILQSLREDIKNGKITIRQAGDDLYSAGWFNYRPDEKQVINLLGL